MPPPTNRQPIAASQLPRFNRPAQQLPMHAYIRHAPVVEQADIGGWVLLVVGPRINAAPRQQVWVVVTTWVG